MIWARNLPSLPAPRLTSFSFGAGIQSTAIMILLKQSPDVFTKAGLTLPSVAMWADTGAETFATHEHVQRLMGWGLPLPLVIVQNHRHGGHLDQIGRPPWFLVGQDGKHGQAIRSCTDKWKIRPLERALRAEAGFKKGERMPAGSIHVWIGISEDEVQRAKDNPKPAFINLYPLLEIGYDRQRCVQLVRDTLPWSVPKSSCFFCPYRRPSEWSRIRREEPQEWERVVGWDVALRQNAGELEGTPYLHVMRKPIESAVHEWDADQARKLAGAVPLFPDFDGLDQECSGLCGV